VHADDRVDRAGVHQLRGHAADFERLVRRVDDAQAQPPLEEAARGVDLGLRELRARDRRRPPDSRRAVDGNEQADHEVVAGGERFMSCGRAASASSRRRALRADAMVDCRLNHRDSPAERASAGLFASPRFAFPRKQLLQ
jgi:hypothetical protein